MPCRHNNGIELHLCTHHLDGLVTVQIQLPLLTATLVLQLELGIVEVVRANFVLAAKPEIQHAYTPNELLVLEIIEEEFSSYRLHTVPNRIVSTIRSERSTTTRHRDANTPAAGQSADEEHEGTTAAVAAMVQPFKGTVNDTTMSSATGAVNTNIRLYFPLKQECPPLCQKTGTGAPLTRKKNTARDVSSPPKPTAYVSFWSISARMQSIWT